MKSRSVLKILKASSLLFLIGWVCVFVEADHPVSAEDAVYDRLTRTGNTNPLDSLAYSILIRHLKRRPSPGARLSSEPQISVYAVLDTQAHKYRDNAGALESSLSSLRTQESELDYPPLEYQLPNDFAAPESQIKASPSISSESLNETVTDENDDFTNTAENNFPASPPRLAGLSQDFDDTSSTAENNFKASPPRIADDDEDFDDNSSSLNSNFDSTGPKTAEEAPIFQIDAFEDNSAPSSQILAPISQEPGQFHRDSFNSESIQVRNPHPHGVKFESFSGDSFSNVRNRLQITSTSQKTPTKEDEEYSTATVIDNFPLILPFKKFPEPEIRPQIPTKTGQIVRSEVQIPPVRPSVPISSPAAKATLPRVRLEPAISKTYGYNSDLNIKPALSSLPIEDVNYESSHVIKETQDLGGLGSNGMQKAVDLLTKFSEDFVSQDSARGHRLTVSSTTSRPRQPAPILNIVPNSVKNSVSKPNSVKNSFGTGTRGHPILTSPFRFQPLSFEKAKETSVRNTIPFDLSTVPINFFNPPKRTYPVRYLKPLTPNIIRGGHGRVQNSAQEFGSVRPNALPSYQTYNVGQKKDVRVAGRLHQIKSWEEMKLPFGYEMFRSIVREIR